MAGSVGYVELTFIATKEGAQYGAVCLELGTATCGATVEEAFDNLTDAVLVHLGELERTGQRERIFKEHGIRLRRRSLRRQLVSIQRVPRGSFASKREVPLAVGTGG